MGKTFDNMFCSVHALCKLTPTQKEGLRQQFYYLYQYKNGFINYVWSKIEQVYDMEPDLKQAIENLNSAYEFDGVAIDAEDQAEIIKSLSKYVKDKLLEHKVLVKNGYLNSEYLNEYNKKSDRIYNFYLPDDTRSMALKDIKGAFEKFLNNKGAKNVRTLDYKDVISMYAKSNISESGIESSTSYKIKREGNKFYIQLRDVSGATREKIFDPYYDYNTGSISKRINFKYYWAELWCSEKSELQRYILNDGVYNVCSKRVIRYMKRGVWRYRVGLSYDVQSPVVESITNQHHRMGVNVQTETVAYVRDDGEQEIIELSPNTPRMTEQIIELQRYMDNSRRATNPQRFHDDGRPKSKKECEQEAIPTGYYKSNRYRVAGCKVADIFRKIREERRRNNLKDAKYIFRQADEFILDNNRFTAWKAKRCHFNAKTAKKYDRNNRKDYTKICYERASAQIPTRIQSLSKQKNIPCEKIWGFNTSMYNHFTDNNDIFTKLRQRLILFDEKYVGDGFKDRVYNFSATFASIEDSKGNKYVVQRDLYGASKLLFLHKQIVEIKDENGDVKTKTVWVFDREGYSVWFENIFYPKHKAYLQQLIEARGLGIDLNGSILGE